MVPVPSWDEIKRFRAVIKPANLSKDGLVVGTKGLSIFIRSKPVSLYKTPRR